jgi:hypothetical protein
MPRLSFSMFVVVAAGGFLAAVSLSEAPVWAQGGASAEVVKIVTTDGVRLNGQFYAGAKGKGSTVIMLHPIGEGKSSKSPEWKALAERLQKGGYSVLMFDFRGHGESTTIEMPSEFKQHKANWPLLPKKGKDLEEIDVKDYIKNGAYLSVLVNDIAAAKAYLDRRNDDGACNTGNTIVIGADTGATLGALWINSEWYRYKFTPNPMFPQLIAKGQFAKASEGSDIIAGIFLTPQSNLNSTKTVSVTGLLTKPCKVEGMPALFFYGKDDAKAKTFNKNLEAKLKVKDSKKHELIGAFELDTNLRGMKLLGKGLKIDKKSVNDSIVDYLNSVVEEKGHEWGKREFENTFFMWRTSPNDIWFAKTKKGEKNLNFDTYQRFIAN